MANTRLTLSEIATIIAKHPLSGWDNQLDILRKEELEREYMEAFISVSHWGLHATN